MGDGSIAHSQAEANWLIEQAPQWRIHGQIRTNFGAAMTYMAFANKDLSPAQLEAAVTIGGIAWDARTPHVESASPDFAQRPNTPYRRTLNRGNTSYPVQSNRAK
jgi:hypothetical protein